MKAEELFEGVYTIDGKLATLNLVSGNRVYDEELVEIKGKEYRLWNPYRSKLAAALLNGMKEMHIGSDLSVLYLGAASGTTSSHVSDIVGDKGMVYCIEISERSVRDLMKVCEARQNMLPMLQDARNTEAYSEDVGTCDVMYQDIAARDQADIMIRNAALLKKGGFAYVAIKSQSIDVSRDPKDVFDEFIAQIKPHFKVLEKIDLVPYTKLHLFLSLQKI
jgi:fibrillarin-like pre-rRNA processing protein